MMDRKGRTIFLAFAFARFHFIRFFYGDVKTIVCATKPSSLPDLKVKIINVILGITVNQLAKNVFCELRNCVTLCIANDEGNVKT